MLLDLPDARYEGQLDYGCGLTSARCVLQFFGKSLSYSDRLNPCPTNGVSPKQLVDCLTLAGLRCAVGTWDIQAIRRLGYPMILFINAEGGDDHYVVARGLERGKVHYFDPDCGLVSKKVEDFVARWHSIDRRGNKLVQGGIAVMP
jgi:ABC-type bacteriocin/lantibiotic exporter with double-glycine peptidase domain